MPATDSLLTDITELAIGGKIVTSTATASHKLVSNVNGAVLEVVGKASTFHTPGAALLVQVDATYTATTAEFNMLALKSGGGSTTEFRVRAHCQRYHARTH